MTNTSDEVWSLVNVHTFIGADPITTTADLDFESTRGVEESVGDRITAPGTFDTIPELAPGASASYTVRVPADQLGADEPGVYWFGVHALGQTAAGRDSVADGRARTFLPLVPRTDTPIDTALVLPVRHQMLHEPTAAWPTAEAWAQTLGEGGQLHDVLDFGVAAGARPITWLVDPAVPAAVRQLQDGNPARALVTPVEGDDGATASPSPSDSASGEPSPAPAEPARPRTIPPSSPRRGWPASSRRSPASRCWPCRGATSTWRPPPSTLPTCTPTRGRGRAPP